MSSTRRGRGCPECLSDVGVQGPQLDLPPTTICTPHRPALRARLLLLQGTFGAGGRWTRRRRRLCGSGSSLASQSRCDPQRRGRLPPSVCAFCRVVQSSATARRAVSWPTHIANQCPVMRCLRGGARLTSPAADSHECCGRGGGAGQVPREAQGPTVRALGGVRASPLHRSAIALAWLSRRARARLVAGHIPTPPGHRLAFFLHIHWLTHNAVSTRATLKRPCVLRHRTRRRSMLPAPGRAPSHRPTEM